MNASITLRIIAALAAVCMTFVLFAGVTALAELHPGSASAQLATTTVIVAEAAATYRR